MNNLMKLNDNGKVTSLELVEQINFFRTDIDGKSELRHNDLLKVIRDEFEDEIGLGEISHTPYIHSQNKQEYYYYELTTSQAKQVLVRESKSVRKAVILYIEKLEAKQVPQSYAQALLEAGRLALELEETATKLEEKIIQLDESKQYYSIKRMAHLSGKNWRYFDWKILKNESRAMELDVKKVFDANFPKGVNVYHSDVWEVCYPEIQEYL